MEMHFDFAFAETRLLKEQRSPDDAAAKHFQLTLDLLADLQYAPLYALIYHQLGGANRP